jgi:sulfate transport system ATP-binding protein
MSIEVRHLSKVFGHHAALRDVSLTVHAGELLALLGPSGSGKTTLLRIIAGLEGPDTGTVHFDGDDATTRSATDRRVGFVFQHYALFRHMTVFENVAFGLRVRPRAQRPPEAEVRRKVNELLARVQLDYLGDRYPSQLSGGQRQRVALARALAVEPKILLLDEPFGALDAKVRQELRRWLRRLHTQIHVTTVFVTHDQEEALELADRVVVMNDGRIEQDGTPEEVVEHPATPFVMTFVGEVNIFRRAKDGIGYARPYELELNRVDPGGGLPAVVQDVRLSGALAKVDLVADPDGIIHVELGRQQYDALQLRVGEPAYITPKRVLVFTAD